MSIGNKLLNKGMQKHSISWATITIIMGEIITKTKKHLNGIAKLLSRVMLQRNMSLVSYMATD